jgi:Fe-S cluster assembly protein SufD
VAAVGDRPLGLCAAHEAVASLLDTYGPEELKAFRSESLKRYCEKGVPTPRDEEWKYTPLRHLEETSYGPAYGATLERSQIAATSAGKLGGIVVPFVNGQYAPELADLAVLPEGVSVTTFADAWENLPAHVTERLGKIATLENRLGSTNDTRFVDLNNAFLGEGAVVYLSRSSALETHVHLLFVSQADRQALAAHPRVLIVLEENAQAKVVESYVGMGGDVLTNAVSEIYLGPHSRLEHVRFQDEPLDATHIGSVFVHQEAGSVYNSVNASFGAKVARVDLNVFLNGEHCETWLNGAYVGKGDQVVDNHTRIDHAVPNCNSFEVYKGILDDRSVGVFNGKIFVYQDAQKTDAKQTNQAILLSPTSSINTKPQLEIFADDVKCTHGATVGQLREDAMFYLRARGIPEAQARAILVYAFVAEVLEKITIDSVRDALEERLFNQLGA